MKEKLETDYQTELKDLVGTILAKRRTEPLQSDHLVVTKIRRKIDRRPERKTRKVILSHTRSTLPTDQDLCTLFLKVKKQVPVTQQTRKRPCVAPESTQTFPRHVDSILNLYIVDFREVTKRKEITADGDDRALEPPTKRPKLTVVAGKSAPIARSIGSQVGEIAEAQHAVSSFSKSHLAHLQYMLDRGLHFEGPQKHPQGASKPSLPRSRAPAERAEADNDMIEESSL